MCEFVGSFVLRGTFIDEVMPKVASLQRSSSEPAMAGHSSTSSLDGLAFEHNYLVRLEASYVARLEAQARRLEPLGEVSKTRAESAASSESTVRTSSSGASASNASTWPRPRHMSELSSSSSLPTVGEYKSECKSECPSPSRSEYASEHKGEEATRKGKAREAPNVGSVGHPALCNRPCVHFARGTCAAGRDCLFCHEKHSRAPHLDKKNRELLLRLSFAQQAAAAVPIMRRQAAKLGLTAEAQPLLGALEEAAGEVERDGRTKSEVASLTSALGVLTFRAMLKMMCKAADTPAWFRAEAPRQLEQMRDAQRARTGC